MNTLFGYALMAEWGLTVLGALLFLVLYGWPGRYHDRAMSWHLASVTAVMLAEGAGLLLAALGVALPLWLFATIYGVATAVIYWRLALLLRARRSNRRTPAA